MTQGERIKEVRNALGLTLEKFGEKLGVTKTAISRLEKGERSLTEQMTKSICREFGVDYIWLTSGDGEMFVESDDDFIERIDRIMMGEDDARKNLFKALLDASDEDIAAFQRIIDCKPLCHFTPIGIDIDVNLLHIMYCCKLCRQ